MKNIQKLALALLVGVMAIGFSAFKAGVIEKKSLADKTYYRLGDNYVFPQPEGSCEELDAVSCTIHFEGDAVPTVVSFPVGQTPIGNWDATESLEKGSYPE